MKVNDEKYTALYSIGQPRMDFWSQIVYNVLINQALTDLFTEFTELTYLFIYKEIHHDIDKHDACNNQTCS